MPDVAPGVYATGYYTDEVTGQQYYYNAPLDQWYYYAAGLLYPLGISWQPSPSPIVNLAVGDTLRFLLSFKFSGPLPIEQTFQAAVGDNKKEGTFGEWWTAKKTWTIHSSDIPVLHSNFYVDLVIPSGREGQDGAAYCKKDQFFIEEGKDSTPYYYDVGHVIEAEGEFTEMKITKFEKVE
ncbi:unnamed protein product [marine sediment metagenome]|uniref:Uncharacterized protein n=1 Tax=marine sediment metagenome TaxID=412755 RepID=X1QN25_9ZZZZ